MRSRRRRFPTSSATCWSPIRLLHFRLANPTHAMHQFFETYFVLQEPTYSSIYAIGQGLVLAVGRVLFGHPWAGVALSVAAFCSLCYWMLRAWTTPTWAFVGGVLAAIQFGPLNQWMNGYWGGAVSATAGCLVFGALPRLRESVTDARRPAAGTGPRSAVTDSPVRIHSAGPVRPFVFSAGAAASG